MRHHNRLEHMIWAPPEDQIFGSLRQSQLVLLTTPTPWAGWRYPYDVELERLLPRLREYCERHLVDMGTYHVPEEVRLYARIPRNAPAGERDQVAAAVGAQPARQSSGRP
jgi:hypothetical protein